MHQRKETMRIFGVDPGLEKSAFVEVKHYEPINCGIVDNESFVKNLCGAAIIGGLRAIMVIEIPICRKWSGAEVSNTAIWAGRFIQAWPYPVIQISRSKVRGLLGCHRGGDSMIRKTLIDRFDPDSFKKSKADVYVDNGSSWFKGFKTDIWQAYAAAVAGLDDMGE
jgi:hypothetical protein